MHTPSHFVILLAALTQAGAGAQPPLVETPQENAITVSQIEKAWKSRQEAIRSFHFECEGTTTIRAGWLFSPGEPKNPDNMTVPPEDTDYPMRLVIMSDGPYLRHTLDGYVVHKYKLLPNSETWVFGDQGHRRVRASGSVNYHQAFLERPETQYVSSDKNGPHDYPLLTAVRAFHPLVNLGGVFERLEILQGTQQVGDAACVVLRERAGPDEPATYLFWVDPAREFVPLRIVIKLLSGATIYQADISRLEHSRAGWLPAGWSFSIFSNSGTLGSTTTMTVIRHEVNTPIAAEEFRLAIPEGAWVHDIATGDEYVVKRGGQKRVILKDELVGMTYDELMATEPGQAPVRKGTRNYAFFLVGGISVGALIVVLCARRAWHNWSR